VYSIGDLKVDEVRYEVRLRGELVECTPSEFKILAKMAASPGQAFSRQELLDAAMGFDHYALDRTVDVHVMNLRRKLERDPQQPEFLLTVKGRGYKLAEQVDVDAS
jgi:DNA-binding response OmpR family regulator